MTHESRKHVPTPKHIVSISFSEVGKLWESRYQNSSKRDSTFKEIKSDTMLDLKLFCHVLLIIFTSYSMFMKEKKKTTTL